ncbi:MAG: M61 family peptidase [Bryobacteraceae bacterium]
MRYSVVFVLLSAFSSAQDAPMKLRVDATDAPQHILHAAMNIPAKPGPMTLLYPEWIPGEHGPTGPVVDFLGLKISAGGKIIPWKRDAVNMYAFHVTVPEGASSLDVVFDFVTPPEAAGFTSGASATTELAVLNWNQVLLYPEGVPSDQLRLQASLKVPNGWKYGTALPIARESGNEIEFQPSSLTTLIDSPVSAGAHYRTIELGPSHYLHVAGDSERAIELTDETIEHYKNLVLETGALFGSRHYRSYHFLLTLSDHVASFGLEHHESSDDRIGERGMVDDIERKVNADLLPHEFTHSWNGKYRRPAGLATPDYSEPMKGGLLWVYEGLTQYLGEILTPRTGLLSADEFREELASNAAALDHKFGQTWRPLEDTAVAAQLLYNAREDYAAYRRGTDYYDEGTLLWLEVDVLIRELSKGAKSLNDFCRSFEGGPGGAPALKTYTFEDVVAGLNAVQAYDWAGFLSKRLEAVGPHTTPLGGIENGGWKLTYSASRSEMWRNHEEDNKILNMMYSIGLKVSEEGNISDVAYGGPAQKAGISPATKLIAVNGKQYYPMVLRDAVQSAVTKTAAIELLVKNGEYYQTFKVDYHGGEMYPHLTRDESKPDVLSKIIEPMVKKK